MNRHISFVVVTTIIIIILALVALGFNAMSTSPGYNIHPWIPTLFFVLAAVVFLGLAIYLFLPTIKRLFRELRRIPKLRFKIGGESGQIFSFFLSQCKHMRMLTRGL